MEELKKYNLVDRVFDGYEFYHIERLENAYEDIDSLLDKARKEDNMSKVCTNFENCEKN